MSCGTCGPAGGADHRQRPGDRPRRRGHGPHLQARLLLGQQVVLARVLVALGRAAEERRG